jgi:hypothetical protein
VLGAGLRREFPGASAWFAGVASRASRPRVSRAGLVWATLAGLGTQALIGVVVGTLVVIAFQLWPPTGSADEVLVNITSVLPFPASAISGFIGTAAGAAVALRSGSWRALVAYTVALVALYLASEAVGWRGRALFCERAGELAVLDVCRQRELVDQALARWPIAAAVTAGIAGARLIAVRGQGTNAILEAVGLVAVLTPVARLAAASFFEPTGDEAMRGFTAASLVVMAAAALAGHLLIRRGGRPWPGAVAIALVYLALPAAPGIWGYYQARPTAPPAWADWLFVAPFGAALALLLGAIVTAALARSRPPDAGAARHAPR